MEASATAGSCKKSLARLLEGLQPESPVRRILGLPGGADFSFPAVVSLSRSSRGRRGLSADEALGASARQLETLARSASWCRTSERCRLLAWHFQIVHYYPSLTPSVQNHHFIPTNLEPVNVPKYTENSSTSAACFVLGFFVLFCFVFPPQNVLPFIPECLLGATCPSSPHACCCIVTSCPSLDSA